MTENQPEKQGHEIAPWTSREGEMLGAPIFLTAEEAVELQETGQVTIVLERTREQEDGRRRS